MAVYGEIAAHSAYYMSSKYKYLFSYCQFVCFFFTSVFGVRISFLLCLFSDLAYLCLFSKREM